MWWVDGKVSILASVTRCGAWRPFWERPLCPCLQTSSIREISRFDGVGGDRDEMTRRLSLERWVACSNVAGGSRCKGSSRPSSRIYRWLLLDPTGKSDSFPGKAFGDRSLLFSLTLADMATYFRAHKQTARTGEERDSCKIRDEETQARLQCMNPK